MQKKAQFYLIAAIIIVSIIIGLATITNYVITKEKPVKFYDLTGEISEESYRVVEYILVSDEEVTKNFTEIVARYIKEDVDNFAVLYGNENEANLTYFTKEEGGSVSVGDVEVKKKLALAVNNFLEPIRSRREALSDDDVWRVLQEGAVKARDAASVTMRKVKSCLHQVIV